MPKPNPFAGINAALADFEKRPTLTHALLAFLIQFVTMIPLSLAIGPVPAAIVGGILGTGFYAGREFEQMAPHWKPGVKVRVSWRSARQVFGPLVANTVTVVVIWMLAG